MVSLRYKYIAVVRLWIMLGHFDTTLPPFEPCGRVDERELEGHVIEHNVDKVGPEGRRPSEDDDSLLTDAEFFERHGMTRDEMEEEYEQERLAAQNAKYFAATEVLPVNTRVPKNKRAQHLLRQSRGHRHDYGDGEMDGVTEGYDPFRLVPLRKYNQQNPAPFRVKVSSDAMVRA